MHHKRCRARKKLYAEVSVGNAVKTVSTDFFKAEKPRFKSTVGIISRSGKRTRTYGRDVNSFSAIGKTINISAKHKRISHKMVSEHYGLRSLHMCVSGHYRIFFLPGTCANDIDKTHEDGFYPVRFVTQIHSCVKRNLIVTASRSVEPFSRIAYARRQLLLNEHMYIFTGKVNFKCAAFNVRKYSEKSFRYYLCFSLGNYSL